MRTLLAELVPAAKDGVRRRKVARFDEIVRALAAIDGATPPRSVTRPKSARVTIHTALGDLVDVELRTTGAAVHGGLDDTPQVDEEHGGTLEPDDDATLKVAGGVVERIQALTGWHVRSEHLLDFNPDGTCAACRIERFEWEDACAACAAREGDEPDDDEEPAPDPFAVGLLARLRPEDARSPWQDRDAHVPLETLLSALHACGEVEVVSKSAELALARVRAGRYTLLVRLTPRAVEIATPQYDLVAWHSITASALTQAMQAATGWSSHVAHAELEPTGPCPSCGRLGFRWQKACPCGTPNTGKTPSEERGLALVELLVDTGGVELASGGRLALETRLANIVRMGGWPAADRLLETLVRARELDEVFVSQSELAAHLATADTRADERMQARRR